jgi:hypothetical protein
MVKGSDILLILVSRTRRDVQPVDVLILILTGRYPLPPCCGWVHHRLQLRSPHQYLSYHVRPLDRGFESPSDLDRFDSLGYIPGHIHAFWLIYRRMQAEERYGHGGFKCTYPCSFSETASSDVFSADVGNGHFEPVYRETAQAPVNYGATA